VSDTGVHGVEGCLVDQMDVRSFWVETLTFGPPSRTWLSCQAGYLARFCAWVAKPPRARRP